MKQISFLFILFSAVLYSQKIQVLDEDNSKAIANARIVSENQIVYTNEDGFAPVSAQNKSFEISAPGYQTQKLSAFRNVVKLQAKVTDIDEVKIVNVNLMPLFEDLSKNYHKRYYDEPSLYDVTLKSKSFNNNQLTMLVIAEAKMWTKSNSYNYKDGIRKNYDNILQMQLNNVKYFKKKKEGVFNSKSNDFNHADMGDYFFNFEIQRLIANMKMKKSKTIGRLLGEKGDLQQIGINIKSENGIIIEGEMEYNKKDKVITFYEVNYQQSGYPPYKKKNTEGVEYDFQLGDVWVTFDFYKKDKTYVSALKKTEADNFKITHDGITDVRKSSTEMIYNTFSKSDKKGLDPKVDFSKDFWDNVPVKEDKETTILLSQKEQDFVNGN
ncbi:carboxypeptidase-like regulatory domain-containing protein [Chryseobacterium oryzae]|uniref:Carboxypeptidase-like regulatory domain-containing protein n=1 Tax=Chryseobacterium oryzae TaxID=2929799 RepID=A0ABY4BNJ1_9FLAO|nr:carboxypeptidase-like regulatory domain-containing protein [Chryseobacterium oryzae]UOE39283.1 carboxypeptidase-like regulatory domain-containing protein [Chryseobacterium oryzae]